MADSQQVKKVYTIEEIKKIAPGYRGKPENFDPAKVGKKALLKSKADPKKSKSAKPSRQGQPQRNDSTFPESIFGIDVVVIEIDPRQCFSANYSKIIDLAAKIYNNIIPNEPHLDRKLAREELSYYTTAMLWLRLLEVKAKQGLEALSTDERGIREAVTDVEFNVPEPIYAYLSQIGSYKDARGAVTLLNVPGLPTTIIQQMGGYHANEINEKTHVLFEEVPSLGIAGDMIMAIAQQADEPMPNFHVDIPCGARATENLCGVFSPIGAKRSEIRQRLNGEGITRAAFPEYVPGTRFNLRYLLSLSDIIGKFQTFRNEKVCFSQMTAMGGETQVISTRPTMEDPNVPWTKKSVQATSSTRSAGALGASYIFGFQLYKEQGSGVDDTTRAINWCCIEPDPVANNPWKIPQSWVANRNERRNLPPGVGTERFQAQSKQQDVAMEDVLRRMMTTIR